MQRTSRDKFDYAKRPSVALRGRGAQRIVRRPYEERATITRKVFYEYESTKRAIKRRFALMKLTFPVMACAIFVIGAFVALQGDQVNQQVEAQIHNLQQSAEEGSSDRVVPDETPPSNVGSYAVAPDQPRFIRIKKLGVEARILQLGVNSKNELEAPSNIYDTGWYEGSSKPGEHGAVLIDGHVHGPSTKGVFYGIRDLVAGDVIEVERGDGKVFNYRVVRSEISPTSEVNMNAALISAEQGVPGLSLITCTGNVNYAESSYDQRIIVFAVQQ